MMRKPYEAAWYASPISLPEASAGKVSVWHRVVKDETPVIGVRQAYLRGVRPVKAMLKEPLRVHVLEEAGHGIWMTDLPEELNQIHEMLHCERPRGSILVGGLGLGILAALLVRRPESKSVTVVERSAGVIKLCRAPGYEVVCDDISRYLQSTKRAADHYLLDTWSGTNEGAWWDEVLPLRRAIRQRFGAKPKIHCWAEDQMWGQVKQSLLCRTKDQAHWHYCSEVLEMSEREVEAFQRTAGLPEWERRWGAAVDATYEAPKKKRRAA
jgi:hypothetical protein